MIQGLLAGVLRGKAGKPSREHSRCPYCAGDAGFFVSSTDYNRGTTKAQFDYFQCQVCGLVFMDPLPGEMAAYYAGGYDPIPPDVAALRVIAAKETYRLKPVLSRKTGGKLLEIGPWRGVFSVNAKDAGFQVSALEMNAECVRFLNEEVGIRAIQSNDPAASLAAMEDRFDVIALWHSMEHLPTPWKVVEAAAAHLAPGGLLLLSIPNIDSFEYSVLQGRWRHLDTPRHLYFYPIQSLVDLCAANGLAQVELNTHDPLTKMLAFDTWRKAAHTVYPSRFVMVPLTRLLVSWARRRESRMEHAGSGLTAVFQLQ